ncbi:MAG: lipoprotein signal peptidase [Gammaproteobacteria bacterium]|nr:lipoprotein signal peptidase [Gammaproteobacteria bacterium]
MMSTIKWFVVAALVVIADQYTKQLAEASLSYGEQIVVTSWFNWTLLYNTGAAFSFLADAGGWQRWFFIILTLVVSAVIVGWVVRLKDTHAWLSFGLACVLGGALGNLYDRAVLGHVIDFIQWHYNGMYWPAFNIADAAIVLGGAILIIDSLVEGKRKKHDSNDNK